jgi:SpoU rRNA methylase family enzyme
MIKINSSIRINAYEIITRAVEEGVQYGYNRAHKHTNKPSKDLLFNEIESAVMNSICEVILFDDQESNGDEIKST